MKQAEHTVSGVWPTEVGCPSIEAVRATWKGCKPANMTGCAALQVNFCNEWPALEQAPGARDQRMEDSITSSKYHFNMCTVFLGKPPVPLVRTALFSSRQDLVLLLYTDVIEVLYEQ